MKKKKTRVLVFATYFAWGSRSENGKSFLHFLTYIFVYILFMSFLIVDKSKKISIDHKTHKNGRFFDQITKVVLLSM